MVPGEADDFCIRLARDEESALVVSADADFLIYTSEVGSLIPLQTFPLQWEDTLYLDVYAGLRASLGLEKAYGLVEVAALLNEDATMGVSEAIHNVLRNRTLDHISREKLNHYVATYTVKKEFSPAPEIQENMDCGIYFGRLTELFFSGSEDVTFWLPFLPITNPPRRSPWLISRPIRQQAYYELREKGYISGSQVVEIVQRGNGVVGETVPIERTSIAALERMTREEVFTATMTILLENLLEQELVYLPYFASMFLLLGSPNVELCSAQLPATMQYLILQYQTILYSFVILLQTRQPSSTTIPEFSTLWDLPRLNTAMVKDVSGGKELWEKITQNMDPEFRRSWDITKTYQRKSKKNKPAKKVKALDLQQLNFAGNNRFSSLA